MKRNYRHNGGVNIEQGRNFDRMRIQPPVFASVLDAYQHMVRHPEEMDVTDNGEVYIPTYDSTEDFFDRMDRLGTQFQERGTAASEETPRGEAGTQFQERGTAASEETPRGEAEAVSSGEAADQREGQQSGDLKPEPIGDPKP